jgi:hypothetical protein
MTTFRIPLAVTIAAASAILFLPSIARSAPSCGPWETLKTYLGTKHHETEFGGGFINPSAVLVLLMSPGGDTWTLAALGTDGNACIMSSGRDWFQRPFLPAEETPS